MRRFVQFRLWEFFYLLFVAAILSLGVRSYFQSVENTKRFYRELREKGAGPSTVKPTETPAPARSGSN